MPLWSLVIIWSFIIQTAFHRWGSEFVFGHSMWVGFLPFTPATDFIASFLHTHLIHFVSSAPVMVRQAWLAGILAIHRPSIKGLHRARWLRGNARDSHSGGPGFKSVADQPG